MWLKIIPEEPLLIGQLRAGSQFLTSKTYIPGRILRGTWVRWLIMQGESNILQWVRRVKIGNFFPSVEWQSINYVLPFPLTAMTCKQHSGFRYESHPDFQGHGVVDTLIPHLAYHLLEQSGAKFTVPFAMTCPQCHGRMEQERGFYTVYRHYSHTTFVKSRVESFAHTKVGLSRYRRAAAESLLYTVSALSPRVVSPDKAGKRNLTFIGRVHGDSEGVRGLMEALRYLAIGALSNRGYGKVKVEEAELAGWDQLENRLRQFNHLLKNSWKDLKRLAVNADKLPDEPDGLYFSIDLLSPGVFRDHGLPSLKPILTIDGKTLEPIFWLTRPGMASGWSTAWGLPKPTQLSAQMGSVYVYRWDDALDTLILGLEEYENRGIGERLDEGYGEVIVCHPFHQEVDER